MTGSILTDLTELQQSDLEPALDLVYVVDVSLGTGGSKKMTVANFVAGAISGNTDIGIGTGNDTPDGRLHVRDGSAGVVTASIDADTLVLEGNGVMGMTFLSPDASNQNIYFGGPNDTQAARLRFNYNSALLQLGTVMSGGKMAFLAGDGSEAMRLDASLQLTIGHTASIAGGAGGEKLLGVHGTSGSTGILVARWANNDNSPVIALAKSRGAAVATNTIVQVGDGLGQLIWAGDDGNNLNTIAAQIRAFVTAAATNRIGADLVFETAAGASNDDVAERLRIKSTGDIRLSGSESALATSATGPFPGMPTMAGTPSGTPVYENAGHAPFVYDTTNQTLEIYDPVANAWRTITTA